MNQSMQAMYKVTSLFSTPEILGVDGLTSDKLTQDPKSEGAVQGKNVSFLDNMAATSVFATSETFAGCSFMWPRYLFFLVMVSMTKVYHVHILRALLMCIAMHVLCKANLFV